MPTFGKHRLVELVWLRAALALLMFAMMSLQPGMVAMAKSAMHPESIVASASAATFDGKPSAGMGHQHGSKAGSADHEADGGSHHGGFETADVCCDAHCTSAHVVPVNCPPLPQPSSGVLARAISAALMPGEASDFIKPPRI